MQKSYLKIYICGLLMMCLLGNATYSSANIKGNSETEKAATRNANVQINAQSITGTYTYKTYKNGEGYDNSLHITDNGDGKLHVFLSGSYNYTNNGSESMHEAEGEGNAQLRGATATANIKDEAGKICRATINFAANQANVKIPDTCRFNIILSGIYKKKTAKLKNIAAANHSAAAKSTEISFEDIDDILNDFDKYHTGEHLIITNVPANRIEKNVRDDSIYNGLYVLSSNEGGGVTKEFLASAALIKNLQANAEFEPSGLRVTAVITQTDGGFDVYRMSFATKIEGLDENGKIIWTSQGTEPTKVKFRG